MEVEIKAIVEDLKAMEEKLRIMGAKFLREVVEEDEYFNHPCRDFAQTDEAVRIRNDGTLTYKGPKVDKDTKSREEVNVEIGSMVDARRLLVSLGFRPVAKVLKRRKYYKIDTLTISLDHLPELGDFVEVECIGEYEPCKERVMSMAKELKLRKFIRKSYLEIVLANKNQSGTT
jgi:adenylate cyclase class 2